MLIRNHGPSRKIGNEVRKRTEREEPPWLREKLARQVCVASIPEQRRSPLLRCRFRRRVAALGAPQNESDDRRRPQRLRLATTTILFTVN